jgi:hypothetical protein
MGLPAGSGTGLWELTLNQQCLSPRTPCKRGDFSLIPFPKPAVDVRRYPGQTIGVNQQHQGAA